YDYALSEKDTTPIGWRIWEWLERIDSIKDLIESFYSLDAGDPVFDDDMPALSQARVELAATEQRLRELLTADQAQALMELLRLPRPTSPVLQEPSNGPTIKLPGVLLFLLWHKIGGTLGRSLSNGFAWIVDPLRPRALKAFDEFFFRKRTLPSLSPP